MTGRELIIYILEHGLEDEKVFEAEFYRYFPTVESVAMKFNVGVATVEVWIENGCLEAVDCGEKTYIIPKSLDRFIKKKAGQEVKDV